MLGARPFKRPREVHEELKGARHEPVGVIRECPYLFGRHTRYPLVGCTNVGPGRREQKELIELLRDTAVVGTIQDNVSALHLDGSATSILMNHHELVVRRCKLTGSRHNHVAKPRLEIEAEE